MRILESNRIILKPVEQEDLPFLLKLRWDSDISNYIIHDPISLKTQQSWFESITKSNDIPFSIFVKQDDDAHKITIAGTTGLYNFDYRHQRAGSRTRISSDYQGKNIAFEALRMVYDYGFNTLNLNKIVSVTFAENIAVTKLIKKVGFVEEGILRSHFFHQGCFRDAVICGLLREDFNRIFNK
jgi:RimJ/RimL family protein N-acetyltransferase